MDKNLNRQSNINTAIMILQNTSGIPPEAVALAEELLTKSLQELIDGDDDGE